MIRLNVGNDRNRDSELDAERGLSRSSRLNVMIDRKSNDATNRICIARLDDETE